MGKKCFNRGFTLIELLIVITIFMVLSTMTLSAFSRYRRSAVISLAEDSLISYFAEARSKAKLGHNAANGDPVCFGLALTKGDKGITLLEWPYDGTDYKDANGEMRSGGCKQSLGVASAAVTSYFKPFNEQIVINSLRFAGESESEKSFVFLFAPPDGDFDARQIDKLKSGIEAKSYVTVELTPLNDENNTTEIKFDLKNAYLVD